MSCVKSNKTLQYDLLQEYFSLSGIFNQMGAVAEVRDGWREIWNAYIAPVTQESIPVKQVLLFANLGWRLAASDHDFQLGLSRLDYYFKHPDNQSVDKAERWEVLSDLALSYLYMARENDALEIYRTELSSQDRRSVRFAMIPIRSDLLGYCIHRPPDILASAELTDVIRITAEISKVSQRVLKAVPPRATYAQLCEVLRRCYPAADREQVTRVARSTPWRVPE